MAETTGTSSTIRSISNLNDLPNSTIAAKYANFYNEYLGVNEAADKTALSISDATSNASKYVAQAENAINKIKEKAKTGSYSYTFKFGTSGTAQTAPGNLSEGSLKLLKLNGVIYDYQIVPTYDKDTGVATSVTITWSKYLENLHNVKYVWVGEKKGSFQAVYDKAGKKAYNDAKAEFKKATSQLNKKASDYNEKYQQELDKLNKKLADITPTSYQKKNKNQGTHIQVTEGTINTTASGIQELISKNKKEFSKEAQFEEIMLGIFEAADNGDFYLQYPKEIYDENINELQSQGYKILQSTSEEDDSNTYVISWNPNIVANNDDAYSKSQDTITILSSNELITLLEEISATTKTGEFKLKVDNIQYPENVELLKTLYGFKVTQYPTYYIISWGTSTAENVDEEWESLQTIIGADLYNNPFEDDEPYHSVYVDTLAYPDDIQEKYNTLEDIDSSTPYLPNDTPYFFHGGLTSTVISIEGTDTTVYDRSGWTLQQPVKGQEVRSLYGVGKYILNTESSPYKYDLENNNYYSITGYAPITGEGFNSQDIIDEIEAGTSTTIYKHDYLHFELDSNNYIKVPANISKIKYRTGANTTATTTYSTLDEIIQRLENHGDIDLHIPYSNFYYTTGSSTTCHRYVLLDAEMDLDENGQGIIVPYHPISKTIDGDESVLETIAFEEETGTPVVVDGAEASEGTSGSSSGSTETNTNDDSSVSDKMYSYSFKNYITSTLVREIDTGNINYEFRYTEKAYNDVTDMINRIQNELKRSSSVVIPLYNQDSTIDFNNNEVYADLVIGTLKNLGYGVSIQENPKTYAISATTVSIETTNNEAYNDYYDHITETNSDSKKEIIANINQRNEDGYNYYELEELNDLLKSELEYNYSNINILGTTTTVSHPKSFTLDDGTTIYYQDNNKYGYKIGITSTGYRISWDQTVEEKVKADYLNSVAALQLKNAQEAEDIVKNFGYQFINNFIKNHDQDATNDEAGQLDKTSYKRVIDNEVNDVKSKVLQYGIQTADPTTGDNRYNFEFNTITSNMSPISVWNRMFDSGYSIKSKELRDLLLLGLYQKYQKRKNTLTSTAIEAEEEIYDPDSAPSEDGLTVSSIEEHFNTIKTVGALNEAAEAIYNNIFAKYGSSASVIKSNKTIDSILYRLGLINTILFSADSKTEQVIISDTTTLDADKVVALELSYHLAGLRERNKEYIANTGPGRADNFLTKGYDIEISNNETAIDKFIFTIFSYKNYPVTIQKIYKPDDTSVVQRYRILWADGTDPSEPNLHIVVSESLTQEETISGYVKYNADKARADAEKNYQDADIKQWNSIMTAVEDAAKNGYYKTSLDYIPTSTNLERLQDNAVYGGYSVSTSSLSNGSKTCTISWTVKSSTPSALTTLFVPIDETAAEKERRNLAKNDDT